jgi:dihydroorotase
MCEAPARIWNLRGKGRIQVGFDADLVLVDLNRSEEVLNERQLTKSGWSPWHGTTLTGWPVRTFVHGQTVYNDGWLSAEPLGREIEFSRAGG